MSLSDPEEVSWRDSALCRDVRDPSIFYPTGTRLASDLDAIAQSREVCDGCPVRVECLEAALSTREPHGTWGGMTEWERERIARGRPVQMSMAMV